MTKWLAGLAVTVIIPTHNPRMDYLRRVLEALRVQTLPREQWELLVVDNGSKQPLAADQEPSVARQREAEPRANEGLSNSGRPTEIDLSWHANARIVLEEELGLTFARLRGFAEARAELIVMVDDDNVLAPDYLETAVHIAQEHPGLGAFGGKCLPEFEVEPPEWIGDAKKALGLRDHGEREELFPREHTAYGMRHEAGGGRGRQLTGDRRQESGHRQPNTANRQPRAVREFPDCAPIGAGMVIRREAAAVYAERIAQRACGIRHTAYGRTTDVEDRRSEIGGQRSEDENSLKHCPTETPSQRAASVITDRRGDSLASGGDNDICLTVVEEGWQVGYLPKLQLTHLIPKGRMTLDYHRRMARDSMKSYVLMLDQHGIRPWPAMAKWTLLLRVASDWWRVKPWRGPEESLRFWGHVGMYEGRVALRRHL